jgi:hypothetical protein
MTTNIQVSAESSGITVPAGSPGVSSRFGGRTPRALPLPAAIRGPTSNARVQRCAAHAIGVGEDVGVRDELAAVVGVGGLHARAGCRPPSR